jgi:D-sedoheptulose 7-phosphate isomerase
VDFIHHYFDQAKSILDSFDHDAIRRVIDLLAETRDRQGRLFLIGSGGGAGHASHATCDFRKIAGFEAYCPTDNVSELSARINDDGWDSSLSNYLLGSRIGAGDCLMVFSVGGGDPDRNISMNLVRAVDTAKERGAKIIGIVGRNGGHTARVADACVIVPTRDPGLVTAYTESFQALVWHLMVVHPALQKHTMKWESSV